MNWTDWWVWMAAGVALAILEVILPGAIFLGFAVGAFMVGLLFLLGIPLGGVYTTFLVFAVISALAWFVLRRYLGVRKGQIKTFDKDIND
ncbi:MULTISPECIES: NfeD family protein [Falsihalocynthiibacter]|uniref:NfeD-like C-terminal domain-containing protein n=1 Tax=Falsihalocynthiibacter arcticus TaxID=1579316 RepID=A0A126UXE9_9RHOB|nr:hypothetical protein [Falsihalocynthiibacter arcticus]AML50742.1 hypothetical protein RC74_05125 [Falsihalocynthiibacter arcticus]